MELFRKKHFTEIGDDGQLGRESQDAFEKAQQRAVEYGSQVVMTLKIIVNPPQAKDPNYGTCGYTLAVTDPPRKSIPYQTKLRDGMIVSTAPTIEGLAQTKLAFYGPESAGQNFHVNTGTGEVTQKDKE